MKMANNMTKEAFIDASLKELDDLFCKNKLERFQWADLMDMVNLRYFKRKNEYSGFCFETMSRKLHRLAINYLEGKQIPYDGEMHIQTSRKPMVSRFNTNENTVKDLVQNWIESWVKVEAENMEVLKRIWYDSLDHEVVELASFAKCILDDTICKHKKLERKMLVLRANSYCMTYITSMQDSGHDRIKDKMGKSVLID